MVRRSELENPPSYSEISSSTIRSLSHCQEIVTRHLSTNAPHRDEDPPSLPRRPSDKIPGNGGTWIQLRKTSTGGHRRRTRVGGRKDYQFPTPRTIQEAPIPRSMERIPIIRRFLGSRAGSLRSRTDRRLLHHTLPRSQTIAI